MRLYLLPISTRRTLIYCQRLNTATSSKPGWIDWATQKAATTWADWEKKEKGWQRKLTDAGNKGLQRIPYEEWGLKSIPPLSATRKQEALEGKEKVYAVFPQIVIPQSKVLSTLHALATERMGFHKSRLTYCIIGMPITIPFMLVPVIPNIPFFYLLYRAFSHWRALSGSKHLQFLLEKNLVHPTTSKILDGIYTEPMKGKEEWMKKQEVDSNEPDDMLLLTNKSSREISEAVAIPELTVELERAVWQVSTTLEEKKKQKIDEGQKATSNNESEKPKDDEKDGKKDTM